MKERWEPVDFGVDYQVSSMGRVLNIKTGKFLAGTINEDGYRCFNLSENGKHSKHKSFYAHVLVMRTFAGPCPEGQQVLHLDGDPLNNRWEPGNEEETKALGGNLVYGTPKENCEDRDQRRGRNGHSNKTRCGTCGEPYDEANTYINPVGARVCRNCVRASGRRHDDKRREEHNRWKRERRAAAHDPEILTTGEAADLLGVTSETIRRWCAQGILPFEQPGKHKRLRRTDVMRLGSRHA